MAKKIKKMGLSLKALIMLMSTAVFVFVGYLIPKDRANSQSFPNISHNFSSKTLIAMGSGGGPCASLSPPPSSPPVTTCRDVYYPPCYTTSDPDPITGNSVRLSSCGFTGFKYVTPANETASCYSAYGLSNSLALDLFLPLKTRNEFESFINTNSPISITFRERQPNRICTTTTPPPPCGCACCIP